MRTPSRQLIANEISQEEAFELWHGAVSHLHAWRMCASVNLELFMDMAGQTVCGETTGLQLHVPRSRLHDLGTAPRLRDRILSPFRSGS